MRNLFTDFETIPDQREGSLDAIIASIHPPANYKKPETIDKWMQDHAEEKAVEVWKKTALEGIAGEICSVSWAFDDGPVFAVTRDINSTLSEAGLLSEFFAGIKTNILHGEGEYPAIKWIGHNVIDFDLRFLYHRSVINNVRPPFKIPFNDRHPSKHVYDTMKQWAGFRGFVKLDALIEALGIELDTDETIMEIDGSMVWDLYQAGRADTIKEYNVLDVERVREVYRRLTWQT